jgi:hypothetical protein
MAKDLIAVDPDTGVRDNCGTILDRRVIGGVPVWLTHDDDAYWIVWQDDRLRKMGYTKARLAIAMRTFAELTDHEIDHLRQQADALRRRKGD